MAKEIDFTEVRKRKRRLRRLRKFIIIILLAAIVSFLYLRRSVWIPELQGIGSRYTTITEGDSEGKFPLTISGDSDYQIYYAMNSIIILSDDKLYIYSQSGKLKKSWSHGLTNACIQISGSKILLYEENSNDFQIYTKSQKVLQDETDNSIIFAKLFSNGYFAIITESDNYAGKLLVFNSDGRQIYTRNCVDRIMDVSYNSKDNSCNVSFFNSEGGEPSFYITNINFQNGKDNWKSNSIGSFLIDTFTDNDGNIYAIGSDNINIISSSGKLLSSYEYYADLQNYNYSGGNLCIFLNDSSRHRKEVLFFKDSKSTPKKLYFDNNSKAAKVYGGNVYVLNYEELEKFDGNGKLVSSIDLDNIYTDFLKSDSYYYLIGYGSVNRFDVDK